MARKILDQIGVYPTLFHTRVVVEIQKAIGDLDTRIASHIGRYNTYANSFNMRRHDFAAAVVTRMWSGGDLPTLSSPADTLQLAELTPLAPQ